MALFGNAILAIWNGIAQEAEAEFIAWHTHEHMPERIGLPGFIRGKRYMAIEGHPKFFNFYETETVNSLSSPIYRQRLNHPTDWTQQVVRHFIDTSRTICDIVETSGLGEGGFIETIRFSAQVDVDSVVTTIREQIMPKAGEFPGIVGVHLLQGRPSESRGDTAEQALRKEPDETADWILFIEAVEDTRLLALRELVLPNSVFENFGAQDQVQRGIYGLQYALTAMEIAGAQD